MMKIEDCRIGNQEIVGQGKGVVWPYIYFQRLKSSAWVSHTLGKHLVKSGKKTMLFKNVCEIIEKGDGIGKEKLGSTCI